MTCRPAQTKRPPVRLMQVAFGLSLSDCPGWLGHAFCHFWEICTVLSLHSLPFRSFLSTIRSVKVMGVSLLCCLGQTAGTLAPRLVLRRGGQGSQGRLDRPHRDQALRSPGGFPGKIGRTGGLEKKLAETPKTTRSGKRVSGSLHATSASAGHLPSQFT
jgi:hypothetical protein